MIGALFNGISGLDIYQKALNSESNNISNVNTVAFKADKISFADMMYQNGYGKGAQVANIAKDFAQGNMKTTGNTYDLAIVGDGYFSVLNEKDETFYTRAGNLRMGTDGTLQTPNGLYIQGIQASAPVVVGTNTMVQTFGETHTQFLGTQVISSKTQLQTINARATNYQNTATASGTSGDNYKTASSKIADIEALSAEYTHRLGLYASNPVAGTVSQSQETKSTFDMTKLTGASDTASIMIDGSKYLQAFESDATTTLNKLSDQISKIKGFTSSVNSATGELTINSLIAGKTIAIGNAKVNETSMPTTTVTSAINGSGYGAVISAKDALKKAIENAGAEFLEITNTVDLSKQRSLTLEKIQLKLDALKLSENPFGNAIIDENGGVYMGQGDNKFIVGKIVTSTFNDNISLAPQGNNIYKETIKSGKPIFAGDINSIKNKTLELSNSDLSEGLVNLMVYQRSFEANSKSVTTSDEFLKTAIGLKR